MPLTKDELATVSAAMTKALSGLAEEPAEEPKKEGSEQTVQQMIDAAVRAALQNDADGDDSDDGGDDTEEGEETPLELAYASLRHIFAIRFPKMDLAAEVGRVTGLAVDDEGVVSGDAVYQPSKAMRGRRPTRQQADPATPANEGGGIKPKSIGDMTATELEALMTAEGATNGAELFRGARLREQALKNADDEAMKTIGRSNVRI